MEKISDCFLIGAATSAHQVEGNNVSSDYWAMEHMVHNNFTEPSLMAVDHYNRFREDIHLLADAGLNAYRFTIEWARIEPEEGQWDEEAIAHYHAVIDECRSLGVEPVVTIHHFTSPKWVIEKGGWEHPAVVDCFARYARKIAEEYGRKLNFICTINEANMGIQVAKIAKRYMMQMKNKKNRNVEGQVQVGMNFNSMLKNMLAQRKENRKVFGTPSPQTFVSMRSAKGDMLVMRAHEAARGQIKALCPKVKVGITLSLHDIQVDESACSSAAELAKARKLAEAEWRDEFSHYLPYLADDDFIGVQNYTRSLFGPDGLLPVPEGAIETQMGNEYYPEALENVVRRVVSESGKPVFITENGIATDDDELRCRFIREALKGVDQLRREEVPVFGYCHWSLLDNFEWQKGFAMTFGLVAVDRSTMERSPKPSLALLGSYAQKR